jgi:hypothetical protein
VQNHRKKKKEKKLQGIRKRQKFFQKPKIYSQNKNKFTK